MAYLLARLAGVCGDRAAAAALYTEAAQRDERAGAPAYVARDIRRQAELREIR